MVVHHTKYSELYTQFEKEMADLEQSNDELQGKVNQLQADMVEKDKTVESVETLLAHKNNDLEELHNRLENQGDEIQDLEKELAQAHHQINIYNQQLQAHMATRESFASSVAVSSVAPSGNENRLYATMSREEIAEG